MSDLPTREEVLADLPEQRAGVYSGDEWDTVIVAYDMELLMTRAEWEATIDGPIYRLCTDPYHDIAKPRNWPHVPGDPSENKGCSWTNCVYDHSIPYDRCPSCDHLHSPGFIRVDAAVKGET